MDYKSVFAPGLFAGKVVLITGGGSGIGRCVAHELAALGAHTVLIGRKAAKLQTVVAEIAQDGGAASFFVCDIRQEDVVKQTVAAVVTAQGRIDGLVNNAGGQYMMPLKAISASTLRIDGARPQVRMGWPMRVASKATQARDAIKPFEGFHRAQVPKVFS